MGWALALAGSVLAVVLIGQYRAAARIHRPLAGRQPAREKAETPLGMEALDLDAVRKTARRNEMLERSHAAWTPRSFLTGGRRTELPDQPDDETYAAWFHTAFLKDRSKDEPK